MSRFIYAAAFRALQGAFFVVKTAAARYNGDISDKQEVPA